MSMRVLLCAVLVLSVFSAQAGVMPKPRLPVPSKALIFGVGAAAAGVTASVALKEHCRKHPDQCPAAGEALDGAKEKAGEVFEAGKKKLSNYKLKKALNEDLGATGEPPNPHGCEAHHIVPRGENRFWARQSANSAREAIYGCIDIESAENGIYLPVKENAQCVGRTHLGLHKKKYYDSIAIRLSDARRFGGCNQVRQELLSIKSDLAGGLMP